MREVHIVMLLCLTVAAVLCDLGRERIPNGIVAAGLICGLLYQLFENGPAGAIFCFGGAALPVLVFGVLCYFRMIGAGDVKLLCMAGGFLGPLGCLSCIAWSILSGGLISLAIMIYRHNLVRRISFFCAYVSRYSRERQWRSYIGEAGEDAKFCFSVPILLGILCQIGGNI